MLLRHLEGGTAVTHPYFSGTEPLIRLKLGVGLGAVCISRWRTKSCTSDKQKWPKHTEEKNVEIQRKKLVYKHILKPLVQFLVSKHHSLIKGTRTTCRSGWFQGWSRNNVRCAWNILSCQEVGKCSEQMGSGWRDSGANLEQQKNEGETEFWHLLKDVSPTHLLLTKGKWWCAVEKPSRHSTSSMWSMTKSPVIRHEDIMYPWRRPWEGACHLFSIPPNTALKSMHEKNIR